MKPLEKALFLVSQGVADNYSLPDPASEFLQNCFDPSATFPNPYFAQSPKPIKFSFGTKKELNIWLNNTTDKYPLMWLAYPIQEDYVLLKRRHHRFENTKIYFAVNNTAAALVETRLQTTRFVLDQIMDKFIQLLDHSSYRKYIYLDKTSVTKQTFIPNWSASDAQNASGATDIWDVMVLEADICLIPSCVHPLLTP